jgi:hypothetical protein
MSSKVTVPAVRVTRSRAHIVRTTGALGLAEAWRVMRGGGGELRGNRIR